MAVRVTEHTVLCPFYEFDSDLGYRVHPHLNGTNRFGFNDQDYTIPKPQNTYRILVIGDSFNWAGGKQGNYVALLRNKIKWYYPDRPIEVINAGYPGMHTLQHFGMLKKYAIQYEPDLVILSFFAGNDFVDRDPDQMRIFYGGHFQDVTGDQFGAWKERRWLGQSKLFEFIKFRMHYWEWMRHVRNESIDSKGEYEFENEDFLRLEKDRMLFCSRSTILNRTYEPHVNAVFNDLAEIKNYLQERGAEFAVILFPDQYAVDENLRKEIMERFRYRPDAFNLDFPHIILRWHLERNNIPFADLLPFFREKNKREPLYLRRNTHLNERGNFWAAEMLFDWLQVLIFMPGKDGGSALSLNPTFDF